MPKFKSMTRGFRVFMPVTAAVLATGCSADVARFDFGGSAGFAENGSQTNSIPIPPANVYGSAPRAGLLGEGEGATHRPPPYETSSRGSDVRVAELPPTQDRGTPGDSYKPNRSYDAPAARSYDRAAPSGGYDNVAAKPYDAAPRAKRNAEPRLETAAYNPAGKGESVEVKPGDTLYSLSRQHGVKVDDIMAANDLKGHSLKPGQRLTLPGGKGGASNSVSGAPTPPPAVAEAAPSAPAATADASAAPAADGAGTYTMKPGDSLYTIARQHKVNYADLQRENGFTDETVRKIRPGTVLKIPAASQVPATRASTGVSLAATGTHIEVPHTEGAASKPGELAKAETPAAASADAPKVLNSAPPAEQVTSAPVASASTPAAAPAAPETKVAAIEPTTATDATPAANDASKKADDKSASSGASRLRWPVQGRVISAFGPRPDGTHNDGVNLSVPLGTDVHAAENGEVIYVGDELKAYGKLVLLRHDNGWVTAYAHNEDLLVQRGKKVARGDVIAKAGKSGPVDQPQVHFELRQDSKAVDPTSFMEKQ